MSIKVDLHTHSVDSPDGSITVEQYGYILSNGTLDCIAITDHNTITFAQKIQRKLGVDKIIVGEEISTNQGDIIGLFLTSLIEAKQDIKDVVNEIKSQGGLVYVPHPFETVRRGITRETLEDIREQVDIIESANGRALFQNFGPEAHSWALRASKPSATSSDAHRAKALGKTFTTLESVPTASNLCSQLFMAQLSYAKPSFFDIIAPKMNRFLKLFKGSK